MKQNLEQTLERLGQMNRAFSSLFFDMGIGDGWDEFKEHLDKFTDEHWMYTYLTALGIGHWLKENNVKPYAFVGGIAVLGNLIEQRQTTPSAWRGSYDIDLVTEQHIIPILCEGFVNVKKKEEFSDDIIRYSIQLDKLHMYNDVGYEPIPYVIDCDIWEPKTTNHYFNQEVTGEFWKQQCRSVLVGNTPLVMASVPALLKLKLNIKNIRLKDISDVFAILKTAERTNMSMNLPKEYASRLWQWYEKSSESENLPSREFLEKLF